MMGKSYIWLFNYLMLLFVESTMWTVLQSKTVYTQCQAILTKCPLCAVCMVHGTASAPLGLVRFPNSLHKSVGEPDYTRLPPLAWASFIP